MLEPGDGSQALRHLPNCTRTDTNVFFCEKLYTLLKKKITNTKICVSPACLALEARWSCSVMETSPSVCEVMCTESIQQYCGLCSFQIQQVIWEDTHSFRLQECEPAIHMYHTELESSVRAHTRKHKYFQCLLFDIRLLMEFV